MPSPNKPVHLPVLSTSPQKPSPPTSGLGRNIPYETFMDCVHCGLCLGSCPTYLETGDENDSPRGRIYLWRAVTDGRTELTADIRKHLDLCLECLGCESACPSGVKYGKIIGSYKKDMASREIPFPQLTRLQRWMLFSLTPYAGRMRWALKPLRLLQALGLRGMVDKLGGFLPASLRRMQEIIPTLPRERGQLPELLPAEGKRRARVALLTGCAADAFFPSTTWATARVLQQNGCEVWIPREQSCCGALHYHAGLVDDARRFATANCTAFGKNGFADIDAILTNAGGCGPVLKEYGHILEGSPQGTDFARKVRDVSEFLVGLGPIKPTHAIPIRAVYHDACGLSHAQKIRTPPRQLLEMIPGLELVALPESELCCGAAGSYNITQPEMAAQLGKRKADHVRSTGARAVFAGNVGCLLQIARHLRDAKAAVWAAHPMDVLWASYGGQLPVELRK
jgi:glycolate oxidase iron-sulfur subunit